MMAPPATLRQGPSPLQAGLGELADGPPAADDDHRGNQKITHEIMLLHLFQQEKRSTAAPGGMRRECRVPARSVDCNGGQQLAQHLGRVRAEWK